MNIEKLVSRLRDAIGRRPGRASGLAVVGMLTAAIALAGCGGGGSSASSSTAESGGGSSSPRRKKRLPAVARPGRPARQGTNTRVLVRKRPKRKRPEPKTRANRRRNRAGNRSGSSSFPANPHRASRSPPPPNISVSSSATKSTFVILNSKNRSSPNARPRSSLRTLVVIFSASTNAAAFGSAVKDAEGRGIPWFSVGSASRHPPRSTTTASMASPSPRCWTNSSSKQCAKSTANPVKS